MSCTATQMVKTMQSWIGKKESNGTFKSIIDTYNKITPLPRGYKMTYSAAWCAAGISAAAFVNNATDIIPPECSCNKMIAAFKTLGEWQENENVTPKVGWIMFYDWDDRASGYASNDNKNEADHVGIVEKVNGSSITVIECNYSDSVKRRTMQVNGRYIRGYGVPKYKPEVKETCTITLPVLKKGDTGEEVGAWQTLLKYKFGYDLGKYGNKKDGVDKDFGEKTAAATLALQKKFGLAQDCEVGHDTWTAALMN